MRQFYEKYFDAVSTPKYENPCNGFESYFLEFGAGPRLEIMKGRTIHEKTGRGIDSLGSAHLALSVGSKGNVDEMTRKLQGAGFSVMEDPRRMGDGYYESIVLDPEGNNIEISI